jgi:hypothetical protein
VLIGFNKSGLNCSAGKCQNLTIVIVNSRPSTAGRDWRLCGDEYGGMKVGNVLLIQMVLSYCLLFWRFYILESH